jgi:type IV pilus assembly protein PilP
MKMVKNLQSGKLATAIIWRSMLVQVCFLLVSCGSGKGDDLDKFMEEAGKDMRVKIEPLPEVKPYVPFQYNADNTLNDPFKPRKAEAGKSNGIHPNLDRPKEPLEAFPLESLKLVGVLSRGKLNYALIKTPDNNIQQVRIGNYLGQNFGIVTNVTETSVTLKEIIQDDLSGDWTERSSSIDLQE